MKTKNTVVITEEEKIITDDGFRYFKGKFDGVPILYVKHELFEMPKNNKYLEHMTVETKVAKKKQKQNPFKLNKS